MAERVFYAKIAALVAMFVVTMLCGLLPMMLVRMARSWAKRFEAGRSSKLAAGLRRHGELIVSCVMCLGAGVLLATIFAHMILEVREVFDEIVREGLLPDIGMPPTELFICAGFFLVFFIEELAHTFMIHGRRRKQRRAAADAEAAKADAKEPADDSADESEESDHEHAGHDHLGDIAGQHAFRACLMVIAMSVHAVFEGLVAAFEDSVRAVWLFFAAIMAHKAIVAFCVGEQMLNTKRSMCFILSNIGIFALATPLGVLLGLLVASPAQQGGISLLASGILQGLAAGAILYVIFFELLGPEQRKSGPGLVKFLATLVGFGLMVIIHSTGGHSHSHGGHAVGHRGHDAHGHHEMPHGGCGHGDHGDHQDDVARRVESAIHAHDDDHRHHHHPNAEYKVSRPGGEATDSVDVKSVPVGSLSPSSSNTAHDEQHHFHADGHDIHRGHGHAGHADQDHSEHAGNDSVDVAGHDHSDHNPADHTELDHAEHAGVSHDQMGHNLEKDTDHSGHDHADHSGDDHADHSDHDHSDHNGQDHSDDSGHDHSDHSGHDHSDHSGHDHSDHSGHDHSDHSGHDHSEPRSG